MDLFQTFDFNTYVIKKYYKKMRKKLMKCCENDWLKYVEMFFFILLDARIYKSLLDGITSNNKIYFI
jgi:hypothetical protein